MFTSRVVRDIAIAHHNGPVGSKCHGNHGHTVKVVVEIQFDDDNVDGSEWGWGPDFHDIKRVIDEFDHKDLNVLMQDPPSMENLARALYCKIEVATGFVPAYVELWEGPSQSIRYGIKLP